MRAELAFAAVAVEEGCERWRVGKVGGGEEEAPQRKAGVEPGILEAQHTNSTSSSINLTPTTQQQQQQRLPH
jgi:hypothetical protein